MFLVNEGHDCLKRFVRYKWTFPVLTYDFSLHLSKKGMSSLIFTHLQMANNGMKVEDGTAQIPTALGMVSPVTTIHM